MHNRTLNLEVKVSTMKAWVESLNQHLHDVTELETANLLLQRRYERAVEAAAKQEAAVKEVAEQKQQLQLLVDQMLKMGVGPCQACSSRQAELDQRLAEAQAAAEAAVRNFQQQQGRSSAPASAAAAAAAAPEQPAAVPQPAAAAAAAAAPQSAAATSESPAGTSSARPAISPERAARVQAKYNKLKRKHRQDVLDNVRCTIDAAIALADKPVNSSSGKGSEDGSEEEDSGPQQPSGQQQQQSEPGEPELDYEGSPSAATASKKSRTE